MNKFVGWLITIYILSILAWSGMLKAETIWLNNVSFDPHHFQLTIEGQAHGACDIAIKSAIKDTQFSGEKPVVIIEIVANEKNSLCLPEESNRMFDMIVDIRSLGLKSGKSYDVAFSNSFSHAESSPLYFIDVPENTFFSNQSLIQTVGILSSSSDGQWILGLRDGRSLTLKTHLDLSKYVGQRVSIEGTEVLHLTGPNFEVEGHSPLRVDQSFGAPKVFLLSISAATY